MRAISIPRRFLFSLRGEDLSVVRNSRKKAESSDYFRVGRVYREAGDWPKAKAIFDKYLQENPNDDKGLAEVGSYYLLNGDRATAEQLFQRSFKLESEMWSTVSAAAAYLGVEPQE